MSNQSQIKPLDMLPVSDFDYKLPPELIAQEPAPERDCSRLMVLDRAAKTIRHHVFKDILQFLNPGDTLVLNNTKVIPAKLVGTKVGGGARIEVLLISKDKEGAQNFALVQECKKQKWMCLVKPGKRLKVGSEVVFGNGELRAKVIEKKESGEQIFEFECQGDFERLIEKLGETPLPPYIRQKVAHPSGWDLRERYQTVYAKNPGAVAAPTAGLHFTPELLDKIKHKGIEVVYLTLHTGMGTFLPMRTDYVEEHKMHKEYFEISDQTIFAIKKAKRVIAVGTTVVRALESFRGELYGETDLFIYPGYKFKVVDAIITNFHWPRSSLIVLVSAFAQASSYALQASEDTSADKSAFAGRDFIMRAYEEAILERYRFYSFGDAMLIL